MLVLVLYLTHILSTFAQVGTILYVLSDDSFMRNKLQTSNLHAAPTIIQERILRTESATNNGRVSLAYLWQFFASYDFAINKEAHKVEA